MDILSAFSDKNESVVNGSEVWKTSHRCADPLNQRRSANTKTNAQSVYMRRNIRSVGRVKTVRPATHRDDSAQPADPNLFLSQRIERSQESG